MSPRLTRRRVLAIAAAATLAPGPARAETWRGVALGAQAAITLRGPAPWRAQAIAAIRDAIAETEALFSLYRLDSWLTRLNAAGQAPIPTQVRGMLALIDRLHAATAGQFDPTVQPLWRALAQGGDGAAARAAIGWSRTHRTQGTLRLSPGQGLSLNGIAQGWATDRVAARLRSLGARDLLVEVGEMRALDGPFRVGLAGNGMITLSDRALATSQPGALRLGRGGHILSPDGRAALWSTVTVEADSAAVADGLSTAGVFLTMAELRAARQSLPGIGRIWVATPDGDLGRV